MAIKIDLLPGYVRLRRVLKWTLLVSFVIVTAVGSVLYVLFEQKKGEAKVAKDNLEMWTPIAAKATAVAGEATAKDTSLANIQSTVQFFADATQTGPRRAVVVDLIRRYIMEDSVVSSVDISDGKNVTIVAAVTDSKDYSNLLLNMRLGTLNTVPPPDIPYVWKSLPKASGIPGYPLPNVPIPNVTGNEPIPKTFPLNISIAGPLLDDLGFSTTGPLANGETVAAGPAGAAGAPPAGSAPR